MKWWIARVLALTSTLLVVASTCLWYRSAFKEEWVSYKLLRPSSDDVRCSVGIHGGTIELFKCEGFEEDWPIGWKFDSSEDRYAQFDLRDVAGEWGFSRAGIIGQPNKYVEVDFPFWIVDAFALTLSLPWLVSRRRRAKAQGLAETNKCSTCGYDLRATPDRCPECGRTP